MYDLKLGDCLEILPTLPPASVDCCVTSPPYYGLRDYGTGEWVGGDPLCDHRSPTMREGRSEDRPLLAGSMATNITQLILAHHSRCGFCGAEKVDSQIGLEKAPHEYVEKLVEVFAQVRRVLRDDGTLWLNLGDSYANDGKWGGRTGGKQASGLHGELVGRAKRATGLKPKDLIGIPWRVALALQEDGWYLRQDIIWHKPNPMPESVKDRCTKSHEYLFLLSKSERYHFDAEAIKEPAIGDPSGNTLRKNRPTQQSLQRGNQCGSVPWEGAEKRHRRSVWTVTTKPFQGAHFATFPPKLIEPCILAGCPAGGTVLDPFAGAGTTLMVAGKLGRNSIGIELNPDYHSIIRARMDKELPPELWSST